jgi:hypothetical protein
MPGFNATVPHTLGADEAATRLKGFVDEVYKRFAGQIQTADGTWNDNVLDFSLTALGMTVKGKLTVDDDVARVEGHLPLAAMPFRGRIQESIASELASALA